MAESKKIKFTFNRLSVSTPNKHLPLTVHLDQEKWQKVLTNLLSNAMKFTPEGGKIDVDIYPDHNKQEVLIQVSNTGPTIPPEKLPFIFDRFYQVDDASNRQYEGTGIGLALVKELVELHGGKIGVESDQLRTLFTIALPLDSVEALENENRSGFNNSCTR